MKLNTGQNSKTYVSFLVLKDQIILVSKLYLRRLKNLTLDDEIKRFDWRDINDAIPEGLVLKVDWPRANKQNEQWNIKVK